MGAISVDIIRSRFNAFTEQDAYDLPVYCPCDNIEPCANELGDYHWVDAGLDGRLSVLSVLPYFGPGWYGRGTVAFMLDAGIITWQDVKTTYNASARRPVSYVAERLKALEEMWLSVGGSFVGHDFTEQRGSKGSSPQILAKFASVAPPWHLGEARLPQIPPGDHELRRGRALQLQRLHFSSSKPSLGEGLSSLQRFRDEAEGSYADQHAAHPTAVHRGGAPADSQTASSNS